MREIDKILKNAIFLHKFIFFVFLLESSQHVFIESSWKGLWSIRGFLAPDFLKI